MNAPQSNSFTTSTNNFDESNELTVFYRFYARLPARVASAGSTDFGGLVAKLHQTSWDHFACLQIQFKLQFFLHRALSPNSAMARWSRGMRPHRFSQIKE